MKRTIKYCGWSNNCGKTNFFEAVEFFFTGPGRGGLSNDLKYKHQSDLEILVEVEFIGAQKVLVKCNMTVIEQKFKMF